MTVAITTRDANGLAIAPVSEATDKMRAEGLPEIAIDTFAHYERAPAARATRALLPEAELEPLDEVPGAEELPERPMPADLEPRRRAEAERRPRHEHGDDEGEVARSR